MRICYIYLEAKENIDWIKAEDKDSFTEEKL